MATFWLIGGQELIVPNVAIEGQATQSSTYKQHIADFAIDGINCGVHHQYRFAHTNADPGAWWQVDLKNQFEIKKVAVTTRKHG